MPQIIPTPGDNFPHPILGQIQSKSDGSSVKVDIGSGFHGNVNIENYTWNMEHAFWERNNT